MRCAAAIYTEVEQWRNMMSTVERYYTGIGNRFSKKRKHADENSVLL